MAPHSSTLAWKTPWMEEPGGLLSMGSHRVGHNWSDLAAAAAAAMITFWASQAAWWLKKKKSAVQEMPKTQIWHSWVEISWNRKWQPTSVFLPGQFHGQRSLVGYSPWGRKKADTTEWLSTHIHTDYILYQYSTVQNQNNDIGLMCVYEVLCYFLRRLDILINTTREIQNYSLIAKISLLLHHYSQLVSLPLTIPNPWQTLTIFSLKCHFENVMQMELDSRWFTETVFCFSFSIMSSRFSQVIVWTNTDHSFPVNGE